MLHLPLKQGKGAAVPALPVIFVVMRSRKEKSKTKVVDESLERERAILMIQTATAIWKGEGVSPRKELLGIATPPLLLQLHHHIETGNGNGNGKEGVETAAQVTVILQI